MLCDYEEDEEYVEDFLDLNSLKQASTSLDLHESASCSCLLPCGLLPEELAELEGSHLASGLQGERAVCQGRTPTPMRGAGCCWLGGWASGCAAPGCCACLTFVTCIAANPHGQRQKLAR